MSNTEKRAVYALIKVNYTAPGNNPATRDKVAAMATNAAPVEADGIRIDGVKVAAVFTETERPASTSNRQYYQKRIVRIEDRGPMAWRVTFVHYRQLLMYTTHNAAAVAALLHPERPNQARKYQTPEEAAKTLYHAGVEACGYKLAKMAKPRPNNP